MIAKEENPGWATAGKIFGNLIRVGIYVGILVIVWKVALS